MHSLLRNIFLSSFLFLILFCVLKCGSSTEEKKENTSPEKKTYKNLSSDIKYVGMMQCRICHIDKYETFIETGMGKSFDVASKKKTSAKFDKHAVVYDKSLDFYYHPFWKGDTMKIMEFRLEGKDTIYKRVESVSYIIGSGQHTNSHLFSTNGYLHQMPITYYTQEGKWDLAPGFKNGSNPRFSRPIGLECMSCHNALPDFVMGSENKFSKVGNGIICERCHGPGEIHVKEKMAGMVIDISKEIDYSIVNPAKLPIDLQFDVCQRCHLQGNTVLKDGKSFYDFRPGMKLSDVMTTFLPKYENAEEDFIMASHADRLKMSQCFIKSAVVGISNPDQQLKPYKNGLTCVTCHNPHLSVKVTGKDVFNNACKNCHLTPNSSPMGEGNKSCSEKPEARNKVDDNCVSCHMPKSGAIDIPHVRITDHFIRKPMKKKNVEEIKKFIGLYAINEENPAAKVKAEGYMNQYEKFGISPGFLDSVKKYLPENSKEDITENFNLLIRYYFLKQDYNKIISLVSGFQQKELLGNLGTTSWDNDDAWTCYRIGETYTHLGKAAEAYIFYNKANELSPFNIDFMNKLAGNLASRNKPDEAKNIYEKIISEDSKYAPAYCNLGYIYFLKQDFVSAEKNYNQSLALDPDYEQALINKAGLLLYEKKNSEALAVAKRILKKNPENEQALAIQMRFTK
ncbi:MAG: tetratricopeptide repeat protein [Bacteroidetes bacterium]|nr:tetratricopeptide repeat protein [Bacteroidota bacterium]